MIMPLYTASMRSAISLLVRTAHISATPSVRPPVTLNDLPMLIPPIRRSASDDPTNPTNMSTNDTKSSAAIAGSVVGFFTIIALLILYFLKFRPWYQKRKAWRAHCKKRKKRQADRKQWLRQFKEPFPSPGTLGSILEVSSGRDLEKAISNIGRDSLELTPAQFGPACAMSMESNKSDLSLRNCEHPPESAPIVEQRAAVPIKVPVIDFSNPTQSPRIPLMRNGISFQRFRTRGPPRCLLASAELSGEFPRVYSPGSPAAQCSVPVSPPDEPAYSGREVAEVFGKGADKALALPSEGQAAEGSARMTLPDRELRESFATLVTDVTDIGSIVSIGEAQSISIESIHGTDDIGVVQTGKDADSLNESDFQKFPDTSIFVVSEDEDDEVRAEEQEPEL